MEEVANNEETTKKLGGCTGKGFMPGISGNPLGRPKNPLKSFSLKEFNSWNDDQKREFLSKISPIDRWKMTEGAPKQDITSDDEPLQPILVKFIDGNKSNDN